MNELHQHEQAENTGAYLLGALSEIELRAFERHLAGCPGCRDEIERLQVAVDALPRSVEQFSAPPRLRRAIMREVEAEAGIPVAAEGERTGAPVRRSAPRLRLPRLRPAASALAAAALAVVVLVGGFGLGRLTDDPAPGPAPARTISASVDQDRLPDGSASLLVRAGASPTLRVQGLPTPKRDRVYQVWLRRGGQMVPDAVFTVRSDGSAAVPITNALSGADAVLVTRERSGGARAPSEVPVLNVAL